MKISHRSIKKIEAVLPAPGWRVIRCTWLSNQPDEPEFYELPVIGFSMVIDYNDDDGELQAVPIVWDEETQRGLSLDDSLIKSVENEHHLVLPPGTELTDDLKKKGIAEARQKSESAALTRQHTLEARRQIGLALLAAHPTWLTLKELKARGVGHNGIHHAVDQLKDLGLIQSDIVLGGSIGLTDKGLEAARLSKEKAAA